METSRAITIAVRILTLIITAPRHKALGAFLNERLAPMQSMNAPTKGPVPLITAVVKPPIFKYAGKHEFTKHPINRGTTIVAPGIFIFFKSIFGIWLLGLRT